MENPKITVNMDHTGRGNDFPKPREKELLLIRAGIPLGLDKSLSPPQYGIYYMVYNSRKSAALFAVEAWYLSADYIYFPEA